MSAQLTLTANCADHVEEGIIYAKSKYKEVKPKHIQS